MLCPGGGHITPQKALKLLHTTSPSLMLLASLDAARANLQSKAGQKLLERAVKNAKYLRTRLDAIPNLHQLKGDFGYKTDVTRENPDLSGFSPFIRQNFSEPF